MIVILLSWLPARGSKMITRQGDKKWMSCFALGTVHLWDVQNIVANITAVNKFKIKMGFSIL